MKFRVDIASEAARDADSILEWLLSQRAGETGIKWFRAMEEAISSLAEFPKRCPLAPENKMFSFEVRQLLYGHQPHVYRILFTVQANTVHVLHIRHGRRQH